MRSLALCLALALPSAAADVAVSTAAAAAAPTPPPGSLESAKIRLDANDPAGALADAEAVVAKGGGADAYAARADAKRALGRPMDEVLADYAQAAKLDPRYIEKYRGLLTQIESEKHPQRAIGSSGLGGVPVVLLFLGLLLGAAFVAGGYELTRAADDKPVAPDDQGPPEKPKKDIS